MVLAVVAAEVGLRVVGWSKPHLYRPDLHRGWALAPGAEGLYTDEGRGWIEVNRFGFRGPAPQVAKPAGTFRVVVLGDSQTEALQVDFEDTFGEVLERRLAGCAELPGGIDSVEVLNFGVSGYGTAQALLTLRHAAAAFAPDLVLLAVYTGNDVRNNVEAIERDPLRPYFVLGDGSGGEGGRLTLDDSFRDEPGFRRRASGLGRAGYAVLDASRLAQVGKAVWAASRDRRAAHEAEQRAGGPAAAEVGLDNDVYREPADPAWHEAWAVTEALVLALDREAAAAGADLALATLSNGIQVHPDAATRRAFAARLGVPDLTYPDRRLTAFARRHDIPATALVFPLARLAEERGLYLHGFDEPPPEATGDLSRWNQGHWNPQGHHAAGTLLADWLCPAPTAPIPPGSP